MNRPFRIAIIGAGPGGLVLAQILRKDPRFHVTVYERGARDGQGFSLSGFRILMSPSILDGLCDQLPQEVSDLVQDAVGISAPEGNRVAIINERCEVVCRMDMQNWVELKSISRWKLREALLFESHEFVQFDKTFTTYTSNTNDKTIAVNFEDGDKIECDLLVGADGAGSKVRKQLLPKASRTVSGLTVTYFKVPLTKSTEAVIPWKSGCMVRSRPAVSLELSD